MKNYIPLLSACALLAFSSNASADDLDRLAGKWSTRRTNEQGQTSTQVIEITKNKLKFKIVRDGETRFAASGEIKVEKCGPFSVMKLTSLKAGGTETDLESVDDEYTFVYQLRDDNSFTLAVGLDKERDQKPSLDVYKKE
jgi:hypothetical protein